MSIHLNKTPVRLAVAAFVLAAAGAVPSARAAIAPGATSVTVREIARIRNVDALPRATSRIRLSAPVAAGVKPQSLSLTLGGFTVDVPLRRGRFRGQIVLGTGSVLAEVRTRGDRLQASFVAHVRDGGSVLGETVVRDAVQSPVECGMAYDLEEAALVIDGVSTPLALGLAARIDTMTGIDGSPRTRARVLGSAIAPAATPIVQIPGASPEDAWTGRVAGHVLATGTVPQVVGVLSGGLPFIVEPIDAEALSYGSAAVDSPGVRSLTIGTDTYYQVRFDMAVQSVPGPQVLVIGVPEGAGYSAKQRLDITVPDTAAPAAISAYDHVLEVREDQTLWAWGDNQLGAVGDGTTKDPVSPVQLAQPPLVRAVAAGENTSLALDVGGAVWLWGEWYATRVLPGGGTVELDFSERVPTPVADLASGVAAIAAGDDHALALDFDGEVWALGENSAGQLGDGTFDDRAKHPEHVRLLPPIVAIAAGGTASLALDADGVVHAWGVQNLAGIGDGTLPVVVAGLPQVVAISAGGHHALALDVDGNVWAWGLNAEGELGDGTQTDSDVPVQVSGLVGVASISAGAQHSLAVLVDGTVWAWGSNDSGELGDGTSQASSVPVRVRDLTGVTLVSAGANASYAVDSTDALWVWGTYRFVRGQVGGGGGQGPGVYPRLAARSFVEGHYPAAPAVVLPKSPR